ncbi:hypothetical protein ES708_29210 [subsurface metagenome]
MKIKLITLGKYDGKESIKSVLMPNNKELLSVKELEQWLPWKAENIRRLLRSGKIEGRKVYTEWYVSRENLYNFLRGI